MQDLWLHSQGCLAGVTYRLVLTSLLPNLNTKSSMFDPSLQVVLDEATGSWGIKVERVEM